jgi:HAD superfamily hydrolase (TIGR01549 family)
MAMIKAVLLDLDNTLLGNPDDLFAMEYLARVDGFFSDRWGYPALSRVILQGIHNINHARDMGQTNIGYMLDLIADATGKSTDDIRADFAEFYQTAYPRLRDCTQTVQLAEALVNELKKQGYAIVIATNPLYPVEAIQQRLTWAGLSDDLGDYALVTHAGNMHFAKPDPAYYAEIVARVGVEPDEALMVGDSLRNDIEPARQVGLHTFHITDTASDEESEGDIQKLFTQITTSDWLDRLFPRPLTPEMIEPELRGNIGALYGTLGGIKPHFWNQHPDPDEWSPIQIVCHLLASETVDQRARLERIRNENNPFIAAPKRPPGPGQGQSCGEDGWSIVTQFVQERNKTISWLRELQPEEWLRPARHSVFGLTILLEMAHFTAQHDRLHINQLCQTLGQCE